MSFLFGGKGTKPPPQVNVSGLLDQQAGQNAQSAQQQASLNNANVISPIGTSGWSANSYDPNTGLPSSYTQSQYLSPQTAPVFNAQTGLAANLANNASGIAGSVASTAPEGANLINQTLNTWLSQLPTSPVSTEGLPPLTGSAAADPIQKSLDFSGLTALPSSKSDFQNEVTQAQNAAYKTQSGYLDPQFAEKHSDLAQQLADQGISAGSAAFDRSQGDLGRQETFAYQQAQNAAVQAGNLEQQALFGENLQSRQQGVGERLTQGNFANAAQQQGFGQNLSNALLSNQANQQGFNQRVTQWGEPLAAITGATAAGEGLLGGAAGQLAGLGSLDNFNWAGGIPSQGGSPTGVAPTNVASVQGAANQGNLNSFLGGNTLNNQLLNGIGSLGGVLGGSNLLFGSGGLSGALGLGEGGLLGLLTGGGGSSALPSAAALLAAPFTGV